MIASRDPEFRFELLPGPEKFAKQLCSVPEIISLSTTGGIRAGNDRDIGRLSNPSDRATAKRLIGERPSDSKGMVVGVPRAV
jgi:hypothetical protein